MIAVSAHTQVKWRALHDCSQFQSQTVQTSGYFYHDINGQNLGQTLKTLWVPLERNLHGHPLAGLLWEKYFEKVLLGLGREKLPNWDCLLVHRQQGRFQSVYVDDITLAGRKQNLNPCGINR